MTSRKKDIFWGIWLLGCVVILWLPATVGSIILTVVFAICAVVLLVPWKKRGNR